jgi:hypothetical protein
VLLSGIGILCVVVGGDAAGGDWRGGFMEYLEQQQICARTHGLTDLTDVDAAWAAASTGQVTRE